MNAPLAWLTATLLLALPACSQASTSPAPVTSTTPTVAHTFSFDDTAPGQVPTGWRVAEKQGAAWQVTEDPSAPSGGRVLTMTANGGAPFNTCWTDGAPFLDGTIQVRFKAISGQEDQGGGIMWRVQGDADYYVVRFNPLEDNLRIYTLRGGRRSMLKSANASLKAGAWHTLKVVQEGAHYTVSLDGKALLDGTDTVFPGSGGVGLWTKADAVTEFDDLMVAP